MSSKLDWTNFFDMDFWQFYCAVFNEDDELIPPDDPGKSAYTAVNTSRYDQGLPITDDIPNETYDTSTGIWFPTSGPDAFIYTNSSIGPTDDVFYTVYGQQFNTKPNISSAPLPQMKIVTNGTIHAFETINLLSAIRNSGLFRPGGYILLEFRSGFPGSVTRARTRLTGNV